MELARKMETIVLSLGGSIIVPDKIDIEFLKQFKELIIKSGHKAVVICGGGKTARDYINAARCISSLEKKADDWIGIMATRLNGELVKAIFGKFAYEKVVCDFGKEVKTDKKVIIGAGWLPGCSTDLDSVLAAKVFGANVVVNLSNIDYVYDKDPRKFNDAKQIKKISWQGFRKIIGNKWKAGMNFPFDPVAAKEAARLKLKVIVMKGTDINNLKNFLEGREFQGSVIG